MTPSIVVESANMNLTTKEFYEQKEWKFSRIPVYDNNKDIIVGYVLKDMVLKLVSDDEFQTRLSELMRPILSFNEDESLYQIWEKMLEKNPFVKHIIIVGASDELIAQVPVHLRERVLFYSQAEIDHHQAWPSKAGKLIHEPVYISIDKDVLRKQDAITDWSNGDMTLMQLQAVLRIIYAHEKVIGIDITGECSATLDYFSELEDAEINNEANEELLRMILEENHP